MCPRVQTFRFRYADGRPSSSSNVGTRSYGTSRLVSVYDSMPGHPLHVSRNDWHSSAMSPWFVYFSEMMQGSVSP